MNVKTRKEANGTYSWFHGDEWIPTQAVTSHGARSQGIRFNVRMSGFKPEANTFGLPKVGSVWNGQRVIKVEPNRITFRRTRKDTPQTMTYLEFFTTHMV